MCGCYSQRRIKRAFDLSAKHEHMHIDEKAFNPDDYLKVLFCALFYCVDGNVTYPHPLLFLPELFGRGCRGSQDRAS